MKISVCNNVYNTSYQYTRENSYKLIVNFELMVTKFSVLVNFHPKVLQCSKVLLKEKEGLLPNKKGFRNTEENKSAQSKYQRWIFSLSKASNG